MLLLRRILAALVDLIIVGGAGVTIFRLQTVAIPDETGNYGGGGCVLVLLIWTAALMYYAVSESKWGFSPGKGLFNLRVVSHDGKIPSFEQSFKRHLLDFVEFQLGGLPALIAVGVTGGSRLGDLWARTRVIAAPGI